MEISLARHGGCSTSSIAAISKRRSWSDFYFLSKSSRGDEEYIHLNFSRRRGRNRLESPSRLRVANRRLINADSADDDSLIDARLKISRSSSQELSKMLREEAAIEGMERKAVTGKSTRRLWPKAVLGALDDAVGEGRWESALQIFSLLRKQKWYTPIGRTYARMMMMLGKCGQPRHASSLFQIMLSEGLRPTPDVYTALVSAYACNSLWDEAFAMIDEMKSMPSCNPDIYTYTILLNSICKLGRFDLIARAFLDMEKLGIRPNVVTYNIIIDGFGKAHRLVDMEKSLYQMIESGDCTPDQRTMNSVLWAFGDSRRIEEMERRYDEFQSMGIEPDATTFNILIRSYGRAGMLSKISLVMDFMKRRFFSPTVVTFNSVIECFGSAGEIEKMEEIFRKMKFQGVKPNSITYCSLVSGYRKAGLLEKIPLILRQIENSDVKLDSTFFNCVISAYGQAGEVKIMEEMFLLMREKHCQPDQITIATMIQAYDKAGVSEVAENPGIRLLETAE
ncbi:LOW protein: PPR containing protein [Wolffia australiana]